MRSLRNSHPDLPEAGFQELLGMVEADIQHLEQQTEQSAQAIEGLHQEIKQRAQEHSARENQLLSNLRMSSAEYTRKEEQMRARLEGQKAEFEGMRQDILREMRDKDRELGRLGSAMQRKEDLIEERRRELEQLQRRMQAEEQSFAEEMGKLKKAQEARLKAMESAHEKTITKITQNSQASLERARLDRENMVSSLKDSFEEQIKCQQQELNCRQQQLVISHNKLTETTNTLWEREQSLTKLEAASCDQRKRIESLSDSLRQSSQALEEEKRQNQQLTGSLHSLSAELSDKQRECEKLAESLQSNNSHTLELQSEVELWAHRYEQARKESEHQIVFLRTKLDKEISALNRLLQIEQEETRAALAHKQDRIASLEQEIQALTDHFEGDLEKARQQKRLFEMRTERQIAEVRAGALKEQEALRQAFGQERAQLLDQHAYQLKSVKLQHESIVKQMTASHEQATNLLQLSLTREQQAKQALSAELDTRTQQFAEQMSEALRKADQQLAAGLAQQKRALEEKFGKQMLLKDAIIEETAVKAEATRLALLEQQRAELAQSQRQFEQALRKEHITQQELAHAHAAQVKALHKEYSLEAEKQHQQHQAQLKECQDKLDRLLGNIEEAQKEVLDRLKKQHQKEVEARAQEFERILAEQQQASETRLQECRAEAATQLEACEARHQELQAGITLQFETRIQILVFKHKEELAAAAKKAAAEQEQIRQQHRLELAELAEQRQTDLACLQSQHAQEIQAVLEAMDQRIDEITHTLEVERLSSEQTRLTTEQKMAGMHQKIDHLLAGIRQKDTQNTALRQSREQLELEKQKELEGMAAQLADKQRLIDELGSSFQARVEAFRREMDSALERQKKLIESRFEDRLVSLEQQLAVTREEANLREESLLRQLAGLQAGYDHLFRLYQQRPPRQQDKEEIDRLNEQISQFNYKIEHAESKIKSMNDVVQYLHLEIENYKEMYAMFGAHRPEGVEFQARPRPEKEEGKALHVKLASIINSKIEEPRLKTEQTTQKHTDLSSPLLSKQELTTRTHRRYNLSFVDAGGDKIASNASKIMETLAKGSVLKPLTIRKREQSVRRADPRTQLQNEYFRSRGKPRHTRAGLK